MANGGGYFTILQSSRNVKIKITLEIEFQLWGSGPGDYRYGIYSQIGTEPPTLISISGVHTFQNNGLGWGPIVSPGTKTTSFLIPHGSSDFPTNQRFYPFFEYGGSLFSGMITKFNFNIQQNAWPSYTAFSSSSYWVTGSSSKNILTGSQFSSLVWGQPQAINDNLGYGKPPLPFKPQIYDQIRFEVDENQVYNIIDVIPPNQNNKTYLKLDRNILDGTNLNSCIIRRLIDDPNSIILDLKSTPINAEPGGFIYPKYMTKELIDSLPTVIKKLKDTNQLDTLIL